MFKVSVFLSFFMFFVGTAAAQTKVCCIGNSITAGVGATTSYPSRLKSLLGSQYSVENDGVSGTTMLKKGDKPYWTKGKFANVFAYKPDIVTIKLGTNDTKPQNWDAYNKEFKTNYLNMIDTLNTLAKKPKIWLVLPVPIFTNGMGIRDSALQKEMVIIKQIAQERSLPLIDANTPLLKFKTYFSDGVHPSDAGADTIAHVIYRALTATAALPQPSFAAAAVAPLVKRYRSAIMVTIPFSGRSVVQVFDVRGKLVCGAVFEGSGGHLLSGIRTFNGTFILRVENHGQSFVSKIEMANEE